MRSSPMAKPKYLPVLWFFLGFGVFMFSRCSRILPFSSNGIAVIIGPIFILGFARTQTARRGILLTLYSTIGDLFAWLCVLGFLGFIVVAVGDRMRARKADK
jgi:hypothetical protein